MVSKAISRALMLAVLFSGNAFTQEPSSLKVNVGDPILNGKRLRPYRKHWSMAVVKPDGSILPDGECLGVEPLRANLARLEKHISGGDDSSLSIRFSERSLRLERVENGKTEATATVTGSQSVDAGAKGRVKAWGVESDTDIG